MSDVLARLRVRESHGIRRFLYPLRVVIKLDASLDAATVGLVNEEGVPVPFQLPQFDRNRIGWRILNFAVSLAPHSEEQLFLRVGAPTTPVPDPLLVTEDSAGGLRSHQSRFDVALDASGAITHVVYDGVNHLRGPSTAGREWHGGMEQDCSSQDYDDLLATIYTSLAYEDRCAATTHSSISACKSWVTLRYDLEQLFGHVQTIDEPIVFRLPLNVAAETLLCDFGVGGGIYGKLRADGADDVVLEAEWTEQGSVRWSLSFSGRTDYVGEVATAHDFLVQCWFHIIDSDKALAVAITDIPAFTKSMKINLNHGGDVSIHYSLRSPMLRLDDDDEVPSLSLTHTFSVCYHFLNDVPAIAAATNPQSILLPPTVEVLPA